MPYSTRNPPGKSRKPHSILTGTKGKNDSMYLLARLVQRLVVALDMTSWAPIPTINNTALSVNQSNIILRRVCGNRNRNRGVLERGSSREDTPKFIQVLIKIVDTNTKIINTNTYCMMYCKHFQQSMDRPGLAANPARCQLNREIFFSLSPSAPENLVSRDEFGRPIPRQPAHSPH